MALNEYGVWEYTCPGAGPCGGYNIEDWLCLLDDMAAHGMNSLALVIKWATTGYKSALPWLDQDPSCKAISSNNRILLMVLAEAKKRNILVWLVVVCSYHQVKEFGWVPPNGQTTGAFSYDPDYPGMPDRMVRLFREIAEIFGAAHGIIAEMESVEFDWPYRVPLYNAWAVRNGRKSYEALRQLPMDARAYRIHDWRDYLTERRCSVLKDIEVSLRAAGFGGKLAMICETCNEEGSYHQVLNLKRYRETMPGWGAVFYEYHRNINRWSGADFGIAQPKELGLETYYLGRGVMTYDSHLLTIPLEENWRRDLEDVVRFGANGFWFFGADAGGGDCHCSLKTLQSWGYSDGLEARRRMFELGMNMLNKKTARNTLT